jgi:tetratricopeptide (TPR) repeat protein
LAATTPPGDDDLDLKPAKAGALFRAEMFTSNVVLGYWRSALTVVVVVLLGILLYGQYKNYHRRSQRGTAAEIAQEIAKLPAPLPELAQQVASGQTVDTAQLVTTADALMAIGSSSSGTASTEALLHAAELYRLASAPDKQRTALTAATESADGVLLFAAEEGLANLELAEGKGEEAVARLRTLSEGEDFLAEQAALDLGLALEHLGRPAEAAEVYASFLTKWPESTRKDEVEEHQARLGGAPASAAPGEAPAAPEAPAGGEG